MNKCEYLENRKRLSDCERIFDPQGSTTVSYAKGKNFKSILCKGEKNFNFRHFWRPSWILAKMNIENIFEMVRNRAISSEFLTHRVVQQYSVSREKILVFTTFGGHLRF